MKPQPQRAPETKRSETFEYESLLDKILDESRPTSILDNIQARPASILDNIEVSDVVREPELDLSADIDSALDATLQTKRMVVINCPSCHLPPWTCPCGFGKIVEE